MSGWPRRGGWRERPPRRMRDGPRGRASSRPSWSPGRRRRLPTASALSHSTVKHHLANARSKVGAATTAQLVWILAPRLPEPEDRAHADE